MAGATAPANETEKYIRTRACRPRVRAVPGCRGAVSDWRRASTVRRRGREPARHALARRRRASFGRQWRARPGTAGPSRK
eukprot:7382412-Prymnesium_polylepis.2